jgi:cytochrome o ubiquinol oxidase subunit 3
MSNAVHHDHEQIADNRVAFGFWVYIMTDCILFGSLFATFAVLRGNTYGGPDGQELFSLPFVLAETLILLVSSFTCGMAMIAAHYRRVKPVIAWFMVTFLLGAAFLTLEIKEFTEFIHEDASWTRSAFLSAFFTLVATHGAHITAGLIWIATMLGQIFNRGLTRHTTRRLILLGVFWHFLDVVWIFIFTFVYLMGTLS